MAIEWKSLRRAYELDGLSIEELTNLNRCKAATISRRAKKEGWKKFSGSPGSAETDKKEMDRSVRSPELIIEEHRKLWSGLRELMGLSLAELRGREDLEGIKEKKALADLLMVIMRGERMAWGLDDTPAEVGRDDKEDTLREMEHVTLSSGAGEALERE